MPMKPIMPTIKTLGLRADKDPENLVQQIVAKFMDARNIPLSNQIMEHVNHGKVLDIGTGSGGIAKSFISAGYDLTPLDIEDLCAYEDIKPIIYDGEKIPFDDGEFETALLINVLHHCQDGVMTLKEAKRVAKRVIFIEDTYRNSVEKFIVGALDSLNNFEFYEHPYKTPQEWKEIIKENDWQIVHWKEWTDFDYGWAYGRSCMFVIE